MAPALTGVVQGTISAATYAATEKIAYGRNPSLKETLKVGITSGVMAGGMQFVGQKLGMIQCFIAGTLVATKNGLVPIEDIEPGDLVWATDEETGETALKEVVQLFRNETEEWVHVTVDGEEITCTPTHPFYSPVKGWTSAIDLRAGDILVMLNGEYVVVEQVQHELLESPETTYNFEVEDFHTYYVGEEPVLVHNKCGQRAAMREAKRSVNIPMSQKPDSVEMVKMVGQDGRTVFARLEKYGDKFIRNDLGGHLFKDGATLPRHFNAGIIDKAGKLIGNGIHYWY